MTEYRKKLIEVALPLDAINKEAAREKSIRHGHPSTLHLWWARRPLAACRAVLFASLVDDPAEPAAPHAYLAALDALPKPESPPLTWDSMTQAEQRRERLFAFIARLVKWEASTDERILGTGGELIKLACEGNPPPVLDPFCGGGSIPLEAQRLGLEAYASDLNPVAVLITKALIEIPPKFANRPPVNPEDRAKLGGAGQWKGAAGLAADVRYYGRWMRDEAERRIGHLYPKATLPSGTEATVIAWLWSRTVQCPNPACGARMPLVRSFALSTKPGKQAWAEPVVDHAAKTVRFEVKTGVGEPPAGTVSRRGASCVVCAAVTPLEYVRSEGMAGRMSAQLMAVVAEGQRTRLYLTPEEDLLPFLTDDERSRVEDARGGPLSGSTPQRLTGGTCYGYGLTTWGDLFTPRQLVALTTFSDLVGEARERVRHDAVAAGMADDGIPLAEGGIGTQGYADAVGVYLGLGTSKVSDYNSSLVVWSQTRDQAKSTFARQALPMVWDYAEVNPLARAAGDVSVTLSGVAESLEKLPGKRSGSAKQLDATTAVNGVKSPMVSTDPPYYDNIGYAELSDYFFVWLRRALQEVQPTLFSTLLTPKSRELVAAAYRFDGSKQRAQDYFEHGLREAFAQIWRIAAPTYPLALFYAFKQAEEDAGDEEERAGPTRTMSGSLEASTGWETMLEGLVAAPFQVLGTWPMRTERATRGVALGTNALASSIVIVCRPLPESAPDASRAEFLEDLGKAMRDALPVLASGRVAPVDLAQASIGPGMAVYSKFKQVIRQDGRPVTVREALIDINNAIAAYRTERVSSFDSETRFCVDWYSQHGWSDGEYGDALTLARAYNVVPNSMDRDELLVARAGKVRLEPLASYPAGVAGLGQRDFRGSAWEACLRLARTLQAEGESGTAALAREMGEGPSARARELAVWLYTIADSKKRTEDAFAFNALDASWSGIQEQITRMTEGTQSRF